jgi:hypothetical protein
MTLAAGCALEPVASPGPSLGAGPSPSGRAASVGLSTLASGTTAPGDLARNAAAAAFADELDAIDPADRSSLLDAFVSAVGDRLAGLPAAGAEAELRRIVAIGTFRLDDQTLLRRLALETKATLGLDIATCAAVARGDRPADSLSALSAAERLEWMRITIAAVGAEVSPVREPRELTREESAAVVAAIAKAATRADATRIHDLATKAAGGTALADDDACWLMRVPYRAEASLTPADRLLLSRYVLGGISG